MPRLLLAPLLLLAAFLTGCAGQPPPYRYTYVPGRTARLTADGQATVPPHAPRAVAAAIRAGNEIAGTPYVYGGGHGGDRGGGYDCSGAASHVLRAAGALRGSLASDELRHYGERGEGRWITVYARPGHAFLVVAGLRFDTGYNGGSGNRGPRWTERGRPTDDCVLRHPPGL